MKVLVTGGTGTISSGIVKALVEAGNETHAITRGNNRKRNIKGVNYIYGDVWNTEFVNSALDTNYDVVIECLVYNLAQLKISLSNFSKRCKQYVFVSTAGIYNRNGEERIKEDDEKNLVEWQYTKDKIECENYLINFCHNSGLNYTIIRPTVTYGDFRVPFPVATRNPGWTFFQRMIDGRLMLASDNVKFSVIHIDDFSDMVLELLGNEKAYNEAFHISDNSNDIYWDDVVNVAGDILAITPQIVHVPIEVFRKVYPSVYDELKYNKNMSLVLNDTKIKNVTQKQSKINIQEGMKRIIEAMKSEVEDKKIELDITWNDYCNATIYYAYVKGFLDEDNEKIVNSYIASFGKKELIYSYWRIKIKRLLSKLRLLR